MKPRPRRPKPATRNAPKPARGRPPGGPTRKPRPDDTAARATNPSGPDRALPQVAPAGLLAEATVAVAEVVRRAVLEEGRWADRTLAAELKRRRDLALSDQRFLSAAVMSLFRWRGWVEPLGEGQVARELLLSAMLDMKLLHPSCRIWARMSGMDPGRLAPLGDAPSWTAKTEGFKRLVGDRAITVDPWRLFPAWFREVLPLPPGDGPPKARFVELIRVLQTPPPLWVRVQVPEPDAVWDELRGLGLKPWVHRRIQYAARLDPEVDVYHLPAFERGELVIQDLASQAVALACDPEPGERWWDACAGAGGKALHLASLMKGRGVVVATDTHPGRLRQAVLRARRSPFTNISTKPWDGKHVAGKPGSFAGVLVDAPCSGLGNWRRNPDARWTLDRDAVTRLAAEQARLLRVAAPGVKPGGVLVYSVCTLTPAETRDVVQGFLAAHPEFRLDPFPHPLTASETDGTLLIWPSEADSDAMYIARMIRTA